MALLRCGGENVDGPSPMPMALFRCPRLAHPTSAIAFRWSVRRNFESNGRFDRKLLLDTLLFRVVSG